MKPAKPAAVFIAVLAAFGGFWLGRLVTGPGHPKPFRPAARANQNIVAAHEFRLLSPKGQTVGALTKNGEKAPTFYLYDMAGRIRLEVGLFGDGRPDVALYDEKFIPRALLKLEWEADIPMFFMKDALDRNRLILALDLKTCETPFLVTFDETGLKNEIFGRFELP